MLSKVMLCVKALRSAPFEAWFVKNALTNSSHHEKLSNKWDEINFDLPLCGFSPAVIIHPDVL